LFPAVLSEPRYDRLESSPAIPERF
jgi:hypothetical protein